jgi:hypothetical protein
MTIENASPDNSDFRYEEDFAPAAQAGNLRMGRLEALYEEHFAEAIEDGVITKEERRSLERVADNLGLDRDRLRRLEGALQAAYEARHRVVISEYKDGDAAPSLTTQSPRESLPPASIAAMEPATDLRTLALERKIVALEARVRTLEAELEDDIDVSSPEDDERELSEVLRSLRANPRDQAALLAAFQHFARVGNRERQHTVAGCLVYLKTENEEARKFYETSQASGLIRPHAALSGDAFKQLLAHPDQTPLVGDVFAVVASAVLLGRISAMRRDKTLRLPAAANKVDIPKTTLQAARCVQWAGAILGLDAPALYTNPDRAGLCHILLNMPPAMELGSEALSGRNAKELAFMAGRAMAYLREEHIVRLLLPDIRNMEEVFLAALSIGNPGLPMAAHIKKLVEPISAAIEPLLESSHVDRLRGLMLRFVEDGGRTNLARFAHGIDWTCARAGLLLSDDLRAAHKVFELEGATHIEDKMTDLMNFMLSDKYERLRKQLGVAV